MKMPLTPKDWELLSAYLDGQLTGQEKRQVQDLLALRPDLGQGLDELRRTRAVLRAAPLRRAPRNFTLTPAMVQKSQRRLIWGGWAPSFGFASALATILFVLSFFFRLTPLAASPAAAPLAAPAAQLSQNVPYNQAAPASQGDSSTPQVAPPIILWNDASQGAGSGMGGGYPGPSAAAGIQSTAAPDMAAEQTQTGTPPSVVLIKPQTAPEATLEATAAAKSAAPQALSPQATTAAASSAENNPILGVAPTQERGKVIVPTQEAAVLFGAHAVEQPLSSWPWVQAGLAGVALISAALALWLWRRARL